MGWAYDDPDEWSLENSEFLGEEVHIRDCQPQHQAKHVFRVVPFYSVDHRDGDPAPEPDHDDNLEAREPKEGLTWQAVHDHLTWKVRPTPFISFFTKFDMALRWKNNFLREGAYKVNIFCYDKRGVICLDANALAAELSLVTLERVGKRHYHEYLVLERIPGENCLGVSRFRN